MNHALTSFDYKPITVAQIKPHIGPPPLEETLQVLSGSDDAEHIKTLVETYSERYGEFGYRENTLCAGVRPMLESLKGAGIRMGICTSKLQKFTIKVLDEFGLITFFDFVSGPQYGIKRSTQLADLLTDGSITIDALMIGDRSIDLISAKANMLPCAGVLWGYGSKQELSQHNPDYLFENPQQLLRNLLP